MSVVSQKIGNRAIYRDKGVKIVTALEKLHEIAEQLGVQIIVGHCSKPHHLGEYNHAQKTITVESGLPLDVFKYALAHELGHAWHAHKVSTPIAEQQADDYAAKLLIDPYEFQQAAVEHDGNMQAIAAELELPVEVINHYWAYLNRKLTVETVNG